MRTIDFLVSSVKINNLSDELQVSYQPDAEVSLQFRGDQESLDTLDIRNAVSVDLSAYTQPGTYEVPVEVIVPDGITFMEGATVTLTLSEKPDDGSTQEEGSSETDTSDQQGETAQQEEEEQNGQR